MKRDGSMLSCD